MGTLVRTLRSMINSDSECDTGIGLALACAIKVIVLQLEAQLNSGTESSSLQGYSVIITLPAKMSLVCSQIPCRSYYQF